MPSPLRSRALFPLVLLLLAPALGCSARPGGRLPQPAAAGSRNDRHAEEELGRGRRAWMERIHRAAPGVDWRAINAENGAREMERRNRLTGLGVSRAAPSPWTEVGSNNLAGRMRSAAIGPDQATLYSGSDLGGVWRGTLAGTDWQPIGDNLYGHVEDLVVVDGISPGDPDVVVVEVDGRLRVTHDGGATWQIPAGAASITSVRGLHVLQDATHTIVCLGRAGAWSALFASIDRGHTFLQRWSSTPAWDGWLWVPRTGAAASSTLYLLHQGNLLRSTNGGYTFSRLASVSSSASSAVLAGSEAGSPALYAAVYTGGQWQLHRSADGGTSFAQVNTLASFWGPLSASITDQNVVIYGEVEAWRSTNGGAGFAHVNAWYDYYGDPAHKLHADIFGLHCLPHPSLPGSERWYFCTDGGTYDSDTLGATVNNLSLSGLGVSQYYSTLTSAANPLLIAAGSQDQGYQRGVFVQPLPAGPSTPFTQLISGDYGHLTSADGTHAWVFSTYPGFILVQKGESNPSLFYVDYPAGCACEWMPPVAADPLAPTAFFFCGDRLWRYTKGVFSTWSPALHSSQTFTAGGGAFLTALAFAPTDAQRAYAVNEAGWVYVSTDHGVTWTSPLPGAPAGQYFYGQAIAVHPTDPLECVVGGSGYSASGVIRTIDGGQTWQPLTNGLPQTLVNGLAYSCDGSGDIHAATDAGAYRYDRAAGAWTNAMDVHAPITNWWSVEAVRNEGKMRFGTYGRGIWDYRVPDPSGCAVWNYGYGEIGSTGQLAVIAATGGDPSFGNPNFAVAGAGFRPNVLGVLFTGDQQGQNVEGWGTIWTGGFVTRTYVLADAAGAVSVAIPVTASLVGKSFCYEFAARDPGFGGDVQHSDALQVTFCP